jgi:hypothetical protein
MSRYILIHRLRVPAILLLIGVVALLHQLDVIDHFWHYFLPLLLILLGVLLLAERAALAAEPYPPYPGAAMPGAPMPGTQAATQPPAAPTESSALVPASPLAMEKSSEGERS